MGYILLELDTNNLVTVRRHDICASVPGRRFIGAQPALNTIALSRTRDQKNLAVGMNLVRVSVVIRIVQRIIRIQNAGIDGNRARTIHNNNQLTLNDSPRIVITQIHLSVVGRQVGPGSAMRFQIVRIVRLAQAKHTCRGAARIDAIAVNQLQMPGADMTQIVVAQRPRYKVRIVVDVICAQQPRFVRIIGIQRVIRIGRSVILDYRAGLDINRRTKWRYVKHASSDREKVTPQNRAVAAAVDQTGRAAVQEIAGDAGTGELVECTRITRAVREPNTRRVSAETEEAAARIARLP